MRWLLLTVLMFAEAIQGGCSAYLTELGAPRHSLGPPYDVTEYADRAAFEQDWGQPVEHPVRVDGFTYDEYRHLVHAPRDHVDALGYFYWDVITLGFAEFVLLPSEAFRLAGVCDYFRRVRVEWDDQGHAIAYMTYWHESDAYGRPAGWRTRREVTPSDAPVTPPDEHAAPASSPDTSSPRGRPRA